MAAMAAVQQALEEHAQLRERASRCTGSRDSRKSGAHILREIEAKLAGFQVEKRNLEEGLASNKKLLARTKLRRTLFKNLLLAVSSGDRNATQVAAERWQKCMIVTLHNQQTTVCEFMEQPQYTVESSL